MEKKRWNETWYDSYRNIPTVLKFYIPRSRIKQLGLYLINSVETSITRHPILNSINNPLIFTLQLS